jgi:hypothetical protein
MRVFASIHGTASALVQNGWMATPARGLARRRESIPTVNRMPAHPPGAVLLFVRLRRA